MKKYLMLAYAFTLTYGGFGQVNVQTELYKTILAQDSLLFNVGFNTCNMGSFEKLLDKDFVFFHDKGGISDKEKFMLELRSNLCENPSLFQARRVLLSTEVYPLYRNGGELYGAIQTGVHQFFEKPANRPETFGSSAKFTHVWLLKKGAWILIKGLSYDHKDKLLVPTEPPIFSNDSEIENWLAENKVPALGLGIISNGKLQQVNVYGELKKGTAAPYNSIFNVASLTKPVTAMVALRLVSLGQWSLDEPVYTYWTDPNIANDTNHKLLTTRIILSHQTGFPNWRFMNPTGLLDFKFTPGTGYQYSGEGFEYLRKALENKFGKTLDQLAAELIFEPLKLADTKYLWSQTDTSRLVMGYDSEGNPYEPVKNKTANAADDLLTTVADYGTFLTAVMDGRLVSPAVYNDMFSLQVKIKENKYFGLGFEIYDLGGEYAFAHGGADKGVQTMVFLFPKTKRGLLIFTNVDDGYKVYERLLTHYLGEQGKRIIDIETK